AVPGVRSVSSQIRVSPVALIGLYGMRVKDESCVRYLLALNFSAVLALPKRSYTALRRGERSVNGGRGDNSPTVRAGTKRPAPLLEGSTPPRKSSRRRPRLSVRRCSVQASIAYSPVSFACIFATYGSG